MLPGVGRIDVTEVGITVHVAARRLAGRGDDRRARQRARPERARAPARHRRGLPGADRGRAMADGAARAPAPRRASSSSSSTARASSSALVVLEAITFLVLVSLFGLTGSRAPTALVDLDGGPLAQSFIRHLDAAHHSFALRPMSLRARAASSISTRRPRRDHHDPARTSARRSRAAGRRCSRSRSTTSTRT